MQSLLEPISLTFIAFNRDQGGVIESKLPILLVDYTSIND
jgi:hypothetical protein